MYSQKSLFPSAQLWVVPPPLPPYTPPLGGQKVSPPLEPFLGLQQFLGHSSPLWKKVGAHVWTLTLGLPSRS